MKKLCLFLIVAVLGSEVRCQDPSSSSQSPTLLPQSPTLLQMSPTPSPLSSTILPLSSTILPLSSTLLPTTEAKMSTTEAFVTTPSILSTADIIQGCIQNCPVTSEYNPVCGSSGITYNNPGRLLCAQVCGVNVNLARMGRCPRPTPAPSA